MATFLRVVAVSVGVANAVEFFIIGSSDDLAGDFAFRVPWSYSTLFALLAGIAGLLIAEAMFRLIRGPLSGGFFARYAAITLGVCLGGALTATLIVVPNLLFFVEPSAGNSVTSMSGKAPYFFVFGGLLGLVEGLFVGLPLAVILGRFGTTG